MQNESLTKLDGVGLRTQEKFLLNSIKDVKDLIEYFPYNFVDYKVGLNQDKATVIGVIATMPVSLFIKKKMNKMTFKLQLEDRIIDILIFNRQFIKNLLTVGKKITVSGKYNPNNNQLVAAEILFKYERLKPIYSLKELSLSTFRKALKSAIKIYSSEMKETLPEYLLKKYKLISYKDMIRIAHYPNSIDEIKHLKRRVKYEELLKYQLKLQYSHFTNKLSSKINIHYDIDAINTFIDSLPFELTTSQKDALEEILENMNSDYTMSRLLQGDVGSGKTIVAIIAFYAAYTAGYQSAFMAPTEILAEQHYHKVIKLLPTLNIKLLTSSINKKDRLQVLSDLKKGVIDIIIGTHSLFQDVVEYNNLGLVITDEQHRFGVEQRQKLRKKGFSPDVLHMSATPIPRTLAITLFGDMDISTIKELPKGRKKITTKYVKDKELDKVIDFIKQEIKLGRQAYIVTALITESEKIDLQNAVDIYEIIKDKLDGRVGLLHGKMKSSVKEEVMNDFKNRNIDCLVSTTVIEVGVDVPNASVMVIIDADRFGLSQLHQLRGRIGRGEYNSYCFLISSNKSDKAVKRLKTIEKISDGFELSEADLKLRGPGDFFGVRQSGYPNFKYADIVEDMSILLIAREDAKEIVYNINDENNKVLKEYLKNNF
ncbi:ATP-dependent DNA helicase RecG [Mycoplasmatota bacterium]|nr:ATP-dependent DNA helicase RecG [Mycoplasmatota bacterium]